MSIDPVLVTHVLKASSEPCEISRMKLFVKLFNSYTPLTIFIKGSILAVWQSSKYGSALDNEYSEIYKKTFSRLSRNAVEKKKENKKQMGLSIREWTKWNLWKMAFRKPWRVSRWQDKCELCLLYNLIFNIQ